MNKGKPLTFEIFLRTFLTVVFDEFRFVDKELKLARGPDHVNIDDALSLGRKGWGYRG